MRALLIGAVSGTRVAMDTIVNMPGWTLAGLLTLPPQLASRHSDYTDLADAAHEAGAELLFSADGNDDEAIERVAALRPDIAFTIGWSSLCGPRLIEAAGGRMIGYHPAALPRLRGRAAIPWTILLEEKITASSLFWISEGVDEGPIVSQRFFHVAPDETATTLYAKHMTALRNALQELLPRLAEDSTFPGIPQDHKLATWGARRRERDGLIDWTSPAKEVERLIRAVTRPYPGAIAYVGGRKIRLWAGVLREGVSPVYGLPGQIVGLEDAAFDVLCGDGRVLRITDYSLDEPARLIKHSLLGAHP